MLYYVYNFLISDQEIADLKDELRALKRDIGDRKVMLVKI